MPCVALCSHQRRNSGTRTQIQEAVAWLVRQRFEEVKRIEGYCWIDDIRGHFDRSAIRVGPAIGDQINPAHGIQSGCGVPVLRLPGVARDEAQSAHGLDNR